MFSQLISNGSLTGFIMGIAGALFILLAKWLLSTLAAKSQQLDKEQHGSLASGIAEIKELIRLILDEQKDMGKQIVRNEANIRALQVHVSTVCRYYTACNGQTDDPHST